METEISYIIRFNSFDNEVVFYIQLNLILNTMNINSLNTMSYYWYRYNTTNRNYYLNIQTT